MEQASFVTKLEQCLRFARLHSWCDQTEAELSRILLEIKLHPEDNAQLRTIILEHLGKVDTLEEKLISLVCLRNLNLPALEISELFYSHLAGKLTKRDRAFIDKHFFSGELPIPYEISQEITDRVFLTYHRAIYQALQINLFESNFDKENVVLFLIQLLCRNNLYDQNRAIIYLLLSRIDAPLPPIIEKIALEAMLELSDVIKDVEKRQASVLADSHVDEEVDKDAFDWNQDVSTKKALIPEKNMLPQAEAQSQEDFWAQQALLRAVSALSNKKHVPPNKAIAALGQIKETLPPELDPFKQQEPLAKKSALSVNSDKQVEPPSMHVPKTSEDSASASALADSTDSENKSLEKVEPAQPGQANEPNILSASELVPGDNKTRQRYQISFNRKSKELSHLLEVLEHTRSQSPQNIASSKQIENNVPHSLGLQRFSRKHWLVTGIVGAAIVVLILLLIFNNHTQEKATSQHYQVDTIENVPPDNDTQAKIATIEGRQVWQAASGQSLWVLFEAIKKGELKFSGSQELVADGWQAFIKKLIVLNPVLSSPDIIQPSRDIFISR